jgi:predicted acylesterase/phospholipase RssA
MTDKLEAARETVLIDLALQGGGSHGTFTWGVLDLRIIFIMLGFPIDPF